MIKGINRQVVEVSETDCDYFEKIMFFVKPEYVTLSENKLRDSASKIAHCTGAPAQTRQKRNRIFEVTKIVLSCLIGAAITLIFMNALK